MPSMRMITVGDAVLESEIEGAGEAVVLLPAGSHHLSYLALLAQQLAAAGFRAVAVNFRGVGASSGRLDGLTLHHLAADIAGVIEALAAAPAHVVGHAFGNRVARCLATDRPDLVRRVVLLAAGGLVPTDPEARRAAHRLRHETLTEAERLELLKAAYLSPESDPRLMLQVQKSPLWDAGDLTETVGQATPLADWWAGALRPSSWFRAWMTAVPPRQWVGAPRPTGRPGARCRHFPGGAFPRPGAAPGGGQGCDRVSARGLTRDVELSDAHHGKAGTHLNARDEWAVG